MTTSCDAQFGTVVQRRIGRAIAGIAAAHALAPSYQETNWPHILELYDLLLALAPTPVVALNRVIALAETQGADAGLRAFDAIPH